MWYVIGIIIVLGLNYFVSREFKKNGCLYSILLTVGSFLVYGLSSLVFMMGARYSFLTHVMLPMIFASLVPLAVYYLIKTDRHKRILEVSENKKTEINSPELSSNEFQKEHSKVPRWGPKDMDDFIDNPKYSRANTKLIILVLAVVVWVLYIIYNAVVSLL